MGPVSAADTTPGVPLDGLRSDEDGRPLLGPPNTNSPTAIEAAVDWWVDWTVARVEGVLGGAPLRADVSAYCYQGMENFTCDLSGVDGRGYGITIVLAGELYLCPGDPDVVDAVSAVYLIGKLLARWSLSATLGGHVTV